MDRAQKNFINVAIIDCVWFLQCAHAGFAKQNLLKKAATDYKKNKNTDNTALIEQRSIAGYIRHEYPEKLTPMVQKAF